MARPHHVSDKLPLQTFEPLSTTCLACGNPAHIAYYAQRTVTTLTGQHRLHLAVRRCTSSACPRYHLPYRPEEERAWALPHGEYGLDVIALVGFLRYRRHQSLAEIHHSLHERGHTHYVVDGGKSRIILATLVVPGEVMDNQPMLDLLWLVSFRWRVRPKQATGDTTYGTVENIKAMEDAHIRAYVPIAEKGQRTGYYGLAQFIYDPVQDQYQCPQGQVLSFFHREQGPQVTEYRANAAICNACPVKKQCTPGDKGRQVHRSFFADYLERVKGYHQTFAYQKAMRKRQVWVEPLFAEGKQWHGMRRFRLRRLWRVNCEALMIASGQNLKRLLQKRGWGRRPFPIVAMAMVSPPKRKSEPFLKHHLFNHPGVAVAFQVVYRASRPVFEPSIHLFSVIQPILSLFSFLLSFTKITVNALLYSLFVSFPSTDSLRSAKLICFSEAQQGVFQQAGSFDDIPFAQIGRM
jgi:hypothetical protein